jgi:hypothetical protein
MKENAATKTDEEDTDEGAEEFHETVEEVAKEEEAKEEEAEFVEAERSRLAKMTLEEKVANAKNLLKMMRGGDFKMARDAAAASSSDAFPLFF